MKTFKGLKRTSLSLEYNSWIYIQHIQCVHTVEILAQADGCVHNIQVFTSQVVNQPKGPSIE